MVDKKKVRGMRVAAASLAMLVVGSGAALAVDKDGTNAGEVLRGSPYADTIRAYGGADLVYGYGGADSLYGGNEAGWGDEILGGSGGDRILGQDGHDALYGEGGNDELRGGYRKDLVVGGSGEDVLDGGPGADETDAQDGRKDTIVIRYGEGDVVYYDEGLDVLVSTASSQAGDRLKAGDLAGEDVELSTERPPQGLFEPHGEVLVEHEGGWLLVPERELGSHLGHGDEIVDPTGRAAAAEGNRD